MPSRVVNPVTRRAIGGPSPAESVVQRAEELDALDAILPFARRDQFAALLTDEDVATLKHLAKEGMGANTLRALASDLGYLEGVRTRTVQNPALRSDVLGTSWPLNFRRAEKIYGLAPAPQSFLVLLHVGGLRIKRLGTHPR